MESVSPFLDEQARSVASALGLASRRILAVSNACASGAVGVASAKELIEDGDSEDAILFGYDGVSRFVLSGFAALSALSKSGARPFDAARDGLSLGEAAGLCRLQRGEARPGDISVAGVGSSNDANHRTGPSRTGEGLLAAARSALEDAGLGPRDVGFVKCHGTATVYNDAMEAKALKNLFGNSIPPCVSFKGALGHTSGGGSLVEMIIAAEILKRKQVPPTVGFSTRGVDEPIPVSEATQTFRQPVALCLSAGFGGVNAAIVLREHI
jgi:3-oxoacyl-[acyl-carrier-protein] synthase-1